ncbi:MAG: DUF1929 domain-containing protein [Proteobacteria bacterium]|nr:MAG: DUF1929 domain-containing protein [Pseudomonadota bacterium]
MIIQVGGSRAGNLGARASDGAIHVDINGAAPVVTQMTPMAFDRIWVSATVLPNGEVLMTGGSAYDNQLQDTALTAEMWNPTTKTFRPLASTPIARMYHSTSLLLPDATVLIGGGGAPGPLINLNAEIYSPPYLFDANGNAAARLTIGRSTSREDYNHLSNISWTGAGTVAKAAMIRTGAVTHSNDMEQRFIPLNFVVRGNTVDVRMPANANLAPPGYYHIFLLNAAGVPSVSKIVSLGVAREKNVLLPGDALSGGDSLVSPDGRHKLTFQADGNLALYTGNNQAIWASGTFNKGGVKAVMQADGNLVIYNQANQALWSSGTFGAQFAGGKLVLQNDSNLVIYKDGKAYWASNTCCR